MKKIILSLIIVLLFTGSAFAAPFLTCDPYDLTQGDIPTHFYLVFDTAAEVNSVAVTGWGPATSANSYTMKHDLASLADGNHTVKARAVIIQDGAVVTASDYSSVWSFSKAKPPAPSILSIQEGIPPKYYLKSPNYAASIMGGPPTSFYATLDNGSTTTEPAVVNADGSTYFKYDITNITTGTHTLNVAATNDWGTSATTTYTFQRYVVVIPKSIKIIR